MSDQTELKSRYNQHSEHTFDAGTVQLLMNKLMVGNSSNEENYDHGFTPGLKIDVSPGSISTLP